MVLTFASVDGDEGYRTYFERAFASILLFVIAAQFDKAFRQFICGQ
jgi:hypothetical protein